ncbi:MAG: YihY/virulence factor BrkB family protein [Myxococcota bacterium]
MPLWSPRILAGPAGAWRRSQTVRVIGRTLRGFFRDKCLLRASALTFASLLALVPFLAVVLALLKGAGFEASLRPFLLTRVPVLEEALVDQLLAYIDRANAQAVGGIGFAALLFASWTMLSNVEESLNHILGVREARGYMRRFGEYLAMLIVGTSILVLSTLLQTLVANPVLFERTIGAAAATGLSGIGLSVLPWLSAWVGFLFLYSFLPAIRLQADARMLGAFVGGTLFQLVQLGYIELQLGFARLHVIYGALAQLPIVLLWIYLSWVVVLLGAELATAFTTRRVWRDPAASRGKGGLPPAALGLMVLRATLDAFREGAATQRADELAARFDVSAHAVREAVEPLLRAGVLVEPDSEHGYLPATSPATISLEHALAAFADDIVLREEICTGAAAPGPRG